MSSFKARLIESSSKSAPVYFITAMADGDKPAWYYLQVDELKQNAFRKHLESGALNLADFGTILHSGWGSVPPEPIMALMEEKYAA